jgi:multidrug efflux system membrane fusion protein
MNSYRLASEAVTRRPPRASKGYVRYILVLLVASSALWLGGCKQKQAQGPPRKPVVPVTVAKVTQRTIPIQIRTIGNVEAYSTISVKAQVGGELTRVYFNEGDYVKNRQQIFQIDPRQYEEQVKQAEANLAKDAAQSENAQADARRYQELFQRGVVSRQEYEAKAAAASAQEATLNADRAAIDNARLRVEYTDIRSPIDGRTGNLAVKQGNLVKENDIPLVTINQIHPIYVSFSVPQNDFTEINKRMSNHLQAVALINNDEQNPVRGSLTFADNAVDQTTGTIRLKATFPNNDNRLWPGQFVNVVLTVSQQPNAVLVPSQAVQTGQNGQFVFVVKPDAKVEMRTVVMSRAVGNEIAIASGVTPGETVVTDGQSRLVPGAQVQVVKSAAQAGGAPPG